MALICIASTPEYLGAIEIPLKHGSTLSSTVQAMPSWALFLAAVHKQVADQGSVSLKVYRRSEDSSKDVKLVPLSGDIYSDLMDAVSQSDLHTLRLTLSSKRLVLSS